MSAASLATQFGTRDESIGQFRDFPAIAFDRAGNAYVCDYGGFRLQVFRPNVRHELPDRQSRSPDVDGAFSPLYGMCQSANV